MLYFRDLSSAVQMKLLILRFSRPFILSVCSPRENYEKRAREY